jgi:hypothetical protein
VLSLSLSLFLFVSGILFAVVIARAVVRSSIKIPTEISHSPEGGEGGGVLIPARARARDDEPEEKREAGDDMLTSAEFLAR